MCKVKCKQRILFSQHIPGTALQIKNKILKNFSYGNIVLLSITAFGE